MTNDEIRDEIKNRRDQIKSLKGRIAIIEGEIRSLKKEFVTEWKVGDRYERKGAVYQIVELPLDDTGKPITYEMRVAKLKLDGTPSAQLQYPYGFEDAKRIESETVSELMERER